MKIVFVSNYFNHHQEAVSLTMDQLTAHQYFFIATKPIPIERLRLGYRDMNSKYPWIVQTYESQEEEKKAKELINNADVVIYGSAPRSMIQERLKNGKLTFFYSERLYKRGYKFYKWPKHLFSFYNNFGRYKNAYLLCASAYTAADFAKTFTFLDKTYKWGYFPKAVEIENIEQVIDTKKKNSI